ncbi:FAD-dependent oxidoreductase [Agrococcus casei]|uniref:FAD-dependent oxidoreductase n=3 Tax=Agrococcus casei TaxID=343512 RepID=UPI003F8EA537
MSKSATVVGAGIAGLAAAIALAECDYRVTVIERGKKPDPESPGGAGVGISSNGLDALAELGMKGEVQRAGVRTRIGSIYTDAGLQLSRPTTTGAGRFVGIHRQTLLQLLTDRAEDLGATIEYEKVIRSDADLPEADLLIGADGIRSTVRKWSFPKVRPDYSGATCWRGVVEADELTPDQLEVWVGRGTEAGIVPIDGGRAYWYISVKAPMGDKSDDEATLAAETIGPFDSPIYEHVLATEPASVMRDDIHYLPTGLKRFTSTRTGTPTILVGDAAHAAMPNAGQGVSQAFEDAATLKILLARHRNIDNMLAAYDEHRVERSQKIQQQSFDLFNLMQANNSISSAVRNGVLKTVPTLVQELVVDWNMRWPNPRIRN